jgi:hypothetical protein
LEHRFREIPPCGLWAGDVNWALGIFTAQISMMLFFSQNFVTPILCKPCNNWILLILIPFNSEYTFIPMLQSVSHATCIKTIKSLPHYLRTTCFDQHWSYSGASKIIIGIAALCL